MKLYKRYIHVISLRDAEGVIQPLYIIDDNGHLNKIEKVMFYEALCSSLVGGLGEHFKIKIGVHMRDVYYQKNHCWFIESHKP